MGKKKKRCQVALFALCKTRNSPEIGKEEYKFINISSTILKHPSFARKREKKKFNICFRCLFDTLLTFAPVFVRWAAENHQKIENSHRNSLVTRKKQATRATLPILRELVDYLSSQTRKWAEEREEAQKMSPMGEEELGSSSYLPLSANVFVPLMPDTWQEEKEGRAAAASKRSGTERNWSNWKRETSLSNERKNKTVYCLLHFLFFCYVVVVLTYDCRTWDFSREGRRR